MALSLQDWIERIEAIREAEGFDGEGGLPWLVALPPAPSPVPPVCEQCGGPLGPWGTRFCSLGCYALSKDKGTVTLACPCGKPFTIQRARVEKSIRLRGYPPLYCSRPCCQRYRRASWRMRRAG